METPREGPVWNGREELVRDFKVLGFAYGFCIVERLSDGQRGTLSFDHAPRVYYDFQPERER